MSYFEQNFNTCKPNGIVGEFLVNTLWLMAEGRKTFLLGDFQR